MQISLIKKKDLLINEMTGSDLRLDTVREDAGVNIHETGVMSGAIGRITGYEVQGDGEGVEGKKHVAETHKQSRKQQTSETNTVLA